MGTEEFLSDMQSTRYRYILIGDSNTTIVSTITTVEHTGHGRISF